MSDTAIESFRTQGSIDQVIKAIQKAVERMKLKVAIQEGSEEEVRIVYKEKLNLLSTNWPLTYEVTITQVNIGEVTVSVLAESKMTSITQSENNSRKARQLLDLIRNLAM